MENREPSESDYEPCESESESEAGESEAGESEYESVASNFEMRGWVSCMESMFGFLVSEAVKACSISGVPEQCRKSEKEAEAYKPKVVSIGPLYRGTKTELLHMEEIKYRFMMSLLFRKKRSPDKYFARCSKFVLQLDMVVRAFYVDEISFNKYDLAKIMLLDGCFLLELLIRNAEQYNQDIRLISDVELDRDMSSYSENAADNIKKQSEVVSDLKLLGNQIPFLVLICLFQLLFTTDSEGDQTYTLVGNTINSLALFYFNCTTSLTVTDCPNRAHLLDIVHSFMTMKDKSAPESNHHSIITIDTSDERSTLEKGNYEQELNRCAYSLVSDGIQITSATEEREKNDIPEEETVLFGCYKSFRKGTVEILPLNIKEENEIEWRNFIAWEQNRITHEKYIGGRHKRTSCKFSEFALSLKSLVCCEHDIKQLKKRHVLDTKWSNEDLMKFFRTIAHGIQLDDSLVNKYNHMIKTFNEYSSGRRNFRLYSCGRRNFSLFWLWHKFRRFLINTRYTLKQMYATLKHDHTPTVWKTIGVIAAAVLLFLTVAQTVFAAIGL